MPSSYDAEEDAASPPDVTSPHRARPARVAAHGLHHQGVNEQADQDGGGREQDVVDEADHVGELGGLAVLGKVGAGEHADGGRHSDAEESEDQAARDGVGQAAALALRARLP
jgi:hypothetical protein